MNNDPIDEQEEPAQLVRCKNCGNTFTVITATDDKERDNDGTILIEQCEECDPRA